MTVLDQFPSITTIANGVTVNFPYPFRIMAANELQVLLDGVETLTGFTVTGVDAANGGFVVFGVPPAMGVAVTLRSEMPYTRSIDYQNNGDYLAVTLNKDVDRTVLMVRQLDEKIARIPALPAGSPLYNLVFPVAGAGKFIRWNLLGTALEVVDGTGTAPGEFLQSGAGAVGRSLNAKMGDVVSVKDFGAIGNGATDDTLAINLAIAALPATGGRVLFPRGTYRTTMPIDVGNGSAAAPSTRQNIHLCGESELAGTNSQVTSNSSGVKILYDGAPGGAAVVRINGPIVCSVTGIHLDCNFKANVGLIASHPYQSNFRDLYVGKHLVGGIRLTAFRTPTGCFIGANDNDWHNVHVADPGAVGVYGWDIGESAASPGELDVARNTWTNCSVKMANDAAASGFILRFVDILNFRNCFVYSGTTPLLTLGAPVRVISPTGNLIFPSEIRFDHCPLIGVMVYDAAWVPVKNRGIYFSSFNMADVETLTAPVPARAAGGIRGYTTEGEFFDLGQLTVVKAQEKHRVPAVLYRDVTRAVIANSVVQTTLATYGLQAGILGTDGILRFRASGNYFNNSGGSSTLKITLEIGGQVIFDSGAFAVAADAGYRAITLDCHMAAKNATNQQTAGGVLQIGAGISVGAAAKAVAFHLNQSRDDMTVDSTVAQTINVKVQHGTASANIAFALDNFFLELL